MKAKTNQTHTEEMKKKSFSSTPECKQQAEESIASAQKASELRLY